MMPVLRIAVTVMGSGENGPRDYARTAEIAPQAFSSSRPTRPSSTRHDRGKGNRNSARSQSAWGAAAIIALRQVQARWLRSHDCQPGSPRSRQVAPTKAPHTSAGAEWTAIAAANSKAGSAPRAAPYRPTKPRRNRVKP